MTFLGLFRDTTQTVETRAHETRMADIMQAREALLRLSGEDQAALMNEALLERKIAPAELRELGRTLNDIAWDMIK